MTRGAGRTEGWVRAAAAEQQVDENAGTARIKLVVTEGFAVTTIDGVQHGGGSTVEVDTITAERWLRRGWVQVAPDAFRRRHEPKPESESKKPKPRKRSTRSKPA